MASRRRMESSMNTPGNGESVDTPSAAASATGGAATATPGNDTDDSKQNLNQVIGSIQKTLGLLHQLHLTVSSFNVASQLPLLQRL